MILRFSSWSIPGGGKHWYVMRHANSRNRTIWKASPLRWEALVTASQSPTPHSSRRALSTETCKDACMRLSKRSPQNTRYEPSSSSTCHSRPNTHHSPPGSSRPSQDEASRRPSQDGATETAAATTTVYIARTEDQSRNILSALPSGNGRKSSRPIRLSCLTARRTWRACNTGSGPWSTTAALPATRNSELSKVVEVFHG